MAKKKDRPPMAPEWAYPVNAEEITDPQELQISPGPEEKKRLAKRLGVVSLEDMTARFTLRRGGGSPTVHVEGEIEARLIQECVVSGQPVISTVKENFEAWFADPAQVVPITRARHQQQLKKGNLEIPMLDESEDPEPIVEGKIDLGELATQYLSLAINPYPHADGVRYEQGDESLPRPADTAARNPFAALKGWKEKLGKNEDS